MTFCAGDKRGQVCLDQVGVRGTPVLAGRNGVAAPKEAAAKAGPADKGRFADIPPINMRRTSSMRSDLSAPPASLHRDGRCADASASQKLHSLTRACADARPAADAEDDAFYSPKSNASFSSELSFSSAAEYLGRSPGEELEASPSGDLNREGSGALPQVCAALHPSWIHHTLVHIAGSCKCPIAVQLGAALETGQP